MNYKIIGWIVLMVGITIPFMAQARTTLVALPERDATVIRLDNPMATLIEEERQLTLQKGQYRCRFDPVTDDRSSRTGNAIECELSAQ